MYARWDNAGGHSEAFEVKHVSSSASASHYLYYLCVVYHTTVWYCLLTRGSTHCVPYYDTEPLCTIEYQQFNSGHLYTSMSFSEWTSAWVLPCWRVLVSAYWCWCYHGGMVACIGECIAPTRKRGSGSSMCSKLPAPPQIWSDLRFYILYLQFAQNWDLPSLSSYENDSLLVNFDPHLG